MKNLKLKQKIWISALNTKAYWRGGVAEGWLFLKFISWNINFFEKKVKCKTSYNFIQLGFLLISMKIDGLSTLYGA